MRPKNEDGRTLQPPHKRLPEASKLAQAGVFAISADGRSSAMSLARKLALVNKVIDHIVDGDAIPKWVTRPDPEIKDNHAMLEFWRMAEVAVRQARS